MKPSGYSTRRDGADLTVSGIFGPLIRRGRSGWAWWILIATLILVLPLADLVLNVFGKSGEAWDHLARTVLPRYIYNTLILGIGTLLLSGVVGTWSAWIMARYRFRGKGVFEILLVLPLALPPYISAYAWSGIFDYGSQLTTLLSRIMDPVQAAKLGVAHLPGAIFILSMALFPYVYLSMKPVMTRSIAPQLEAARNLGSGRTSLFFRTALPLARPALVAGLGLVLMEVLNEYGAVSYLGVDTLTAGIFRSWFHFYDISTARRLGGILLLFVFFILSAEHRQRHRRRYFSTNNRRPDSTEALIGWRLAGAFSGLIVLIFISLAAPMMQLGLWASRSWHYLLRDEFMDLTINTLFLGISAVAICLILAITLVYARKLVKDSVFRRISSLAFLGYAIPGAVIALGVMQIGGRVDGFITGGRSLFMSGSISALLYAYAIRYLPIAQRPISAVLEERFSAVDEASLSLGKRPLATLVKIHLPNMSGTLKAASILVFLDVLKELPLTMILRPFNFNTLAVRTFELAGNEQVAESSIPALTLVLLSALGILVMSIRGKGKEKGPL